jgi:hypothetical protein
MILNSCSRAFEDSNRNLSLMIVAKIKTKIFIRIFQLLTSTCSTTLKVAVKKNFLIGDKKKAKLSLSQAVEDFRVVRRRDSHIF